MQSLQRRLKHLEQRTSSGGQMALRFIVMQAGSPFGEDFERTRRALDRCGYAQGPSVIFLWPEPGGMSHEEWEKFLQAYDEEVSTPGSRNRSGERGTIAGRK
jgi:hypothetical protein